MTTAETRPYDAAAPGPVAIEELHVVVPVRDEEEQLPRHLAALDAARQSMTDTCPGVGLMIHVVLDSCRDRSAGIVAACEWVDTISVGFGAVGAARAAGVERARAHCLGTPPTYVWIACTDADSLVPPDWLVGHLSLATTGAQFVTGTVHPDPDGLDSGLLASWWSRHVLREGHDHVHGANLGFTLAAYDQVGGFEPVASGEDVSLVTRMRAANLSGHRTSRFPVTTSGRTRGRAPGGFADYLDRLRQ